MNYDFFIGPNGKPCAKPVNNGNYGNDDFLKKLESVGRVPRGTGLAVLSYLGEFLADKLSVGATVTLDGIGTFGASTKLEYEEGKKIDGNDVELKRVTFRANPQLKQEIARQIVRRRVSVSMRKNLNVPDIDVRKDRLVKLLEKKGFINSSDYMSVAHVCRTQAYDDLAEFEKGEVITSQKVGHIKIYRLK